MATIGDVAAAILHERPTLTTMKLQKLAYYAQAVSLAERGIPLFDADFQAWRNCPVAPELFDLHRRMFIIHDGELRGDVDAARLTVEERRIVNRVCAALGNYTGNQLSERTHREAPWKDARGTLSPAERCHTVITKKAMRDYYSVHPPLGNA